MNPNDSVRKIMTSDMITVSPNHTLTDIQHIFEQNDFHHLPVVEEGDRLIGIISREDFLKTCYSMLMTTSGKSWTQKQFDTMTAKEIMTADPLVLDPDDHTLGLAADIFLANKFHSLPVVEDGRLLGIVTTHDLLAYSYASEL